MSWLPVATAASALGDMLDSPQAVLHLRHPTPQPLSALVSTISDLLHLERIPFREWLNRVREAHAQHAGDLQKGRLENALRLMDVFEYAVQAAEGHEDAVEDYGILRHVEMVQGIAASATLREVATKGQMVGKSEIASWIGWWTMIGFLPPPV